MKRLELILAVSDVLLGLYGVREQRQNNLIKKFGKDNAKQIQQEVNKCLASSIEHKYLAVACIAGHYGNNIERIQKLDRWRDKVQSQINLIYSMRGKTLEKVAKDVINNNFDKQDVRELLLKFCGYDPKKVQQKVNEILDSKSKQPQKETKEFCIHAVHFFKKNENEYGDCTAIYQYAKDGTIEKCILIDCAKDTASNVVIEELKKQGVKQIDVIFISHAHGDHYGGLSKIAKAFPIKWLYLPDCTELDKYQKGYGNKLRRQAAKISNHRYLKPGDNFVIGDIKGNCAYIAPANKLSKHDDHIFVNNESMATRFNLDGIIFHSAGDMSNPANNLMVQAIPNLKADIFKLQWHGDGNAINNKLMQAIKPKYAFSNYHHKEGSGRGGSRKKVEAVGGKVYRNWENGDIFFHIKNGKINVTTKK